MGEKTNTSQNSEFIEVNPQLLSVYCSKEEGGIDLREGCAEAEKAGSWEWYSLQFGICRAWGMSDLQNGDNVSIGTYQLGIIYSLKNTVLLSSQQSKSSHQHHNYFFLDFWHSKYSQPLQIHSGQSTSDSNVQTAEVFYPNRSVLKNAGVFFTV